MTADTQQLLQAALPALWFFVLAAALVAYPVFNYFMIRRALARVGRAYCAEHGVHYLGIKHAKSHFSVIYSSSGKRNYAKFILHTSLGRVRKVEWVA